MSYCLSYFLYFFFLYCWYSDIQYFCEPVYLGLQFHNCLLLCSYCLSFVGSHLSFFTCMFFHMKPDFHSNILVTVYSYWCVIESSMSILFCSPSFCSSVYFFYCGLPHYPRRRMYVGGTTVLSSGSVYLYLTLSSHHRLSILILHLCTFHIRMWLSPRHTVLLVYYMDLYRLLLVIRYGLFYLFFVFSIDILCCSALISFARPPLHVCLLVLCNIILPVSSIDRFFVLFPPLVVSSHENDVCFFLTICYAYL